MKKFYELKINRISKGFFKKKSNIIRFLKRYAEKHKIKINNISLIYKREVLTYSDKRGKQKFIVVEENRFIDENIKFKEV